MCGAEKLPLFAGDALREGITADLELAVAMRTFEACPVKEETVGGHSLHEVDALVAEVAEVAGVSGGRFEPQGSRGDVARQLRGRLGSWLLLRMGEK